jgi:hypothetical protein
MDSNGIFGGGSLLTKRSRLIGLFLLLIFTHGVRGVSKEALREFEWFQSLGFPDIRGKSFVEFTDRTGLDFTGRTRPRRIRGFVISTNAERFTVLTTGLGELSFSSRQQEAKSPTDFKLLPLEVYRTPPGKAPLQLYDLSDAFVLAWACWQQGLEDRAEDLFLMSRVALLMWQSEKAKLGFHRILEDELAEKLMWHGFSEMADARLPWSRMLADFEKVATKFPGSKYGAEAQGYVKILSKMIDEDRSHRSRKLEELESLPLEEKVSELIFLLRDQNVNQYNAPGMCDVLRPWDHSTNTPAHYLAAIGRPAVPRLIAALEDHRLTRSIGFHRSWYYSHIVITVGECARQILERILGEKFAVDEWARYMLEEKDIRAVKRQVERWWRHTRRMEGRESMAEKSRAAQ